MQVNYELYHKPFLKILFEQFFLTVKWHTGANDYWNIYFFSDFNKTNTLTV